LVCYFGHRSHHLQGIGGLTAIDTAIARKLLQYYLFEFQRRNTRQKEYCGKRAALQLRRDPGLGINKSRPKAALNSNLMMVDQAANNAGFDFRR
jgi:hypothetical protein